MSELLALGAVATVALAAGARAGSRASVLPPPGPGWVARMSFSIPLQGGLEAPRDRIAKGNRVCLARALTVRDWRPYTGGPNAGAAAYRTAAALVSPTAARGTLWVWLSKGPTALWTWADWGKTVLNDAVEGFVAEGPIDPELGEIGIIPRIGGVERVG
jgi:hypothetical protein